MSTTKRILAIAATALLALAACTKPEPPPPATAEAPPATTAATPVSIGPGETGGVCEGFAGVQCKSKGDFCKKEVGQCKVADAQGVCTKKPEICTKEINRVCGCDGRTYANPCVAAAAGVSVAAMGACETPKDG